MRDKIKMVSSEGNGHYYTTTKNKRTMPEKMEMKKYDPVARKHVMYKEAKIKELILYFTAFMIVRGKVGFTLSCKWSF